MKTMCGNAVGFFSYSFGERLVWVGLQRLRGNANNEEEVEIDAGNQEEGLRHTDDDEEEEGPS